MTRIVGIVGGSGAGKTTLAQALARCVGAGAFVIAEDDYYRCASTIPDFDPGMHNFDAPDAKEHTLLREHIALARSGSHFDKPVYDLATHRRLPRVERVAHAETLIVEGLHLLTREDLRVLFDLKVYIDADEAVRLGRRMIRDVEARGRTPRAVLAQFFSTVRPMHEAYVAPQRQYADIVLISPAQAGPEHAEADAARIAEALG